MSFAVEFEVSFLIEVVPILEEIGLFGECL